MNDVLLIGATSGDGRAVLLEAFGIDAVRHRTLLLDTKYYEAELQLVDLAVGDSLPAAVVGEHPQAVIIVVENESTWDIPSCLDGIVDLGLVEVGLMVHVGKAPSDDRFRTMADLLQIEFVDAFASGFERVKEALECHRWPQMRMKQTKPDTERPAVSLENDLDDMDDLFKLIMHVKSQGANLPHAERRKLATDAVLRLAAMFADHDDEATGDDAA